MKSADWYPHYHNKFLTGTVELNLEERGAYITILDLLYSRLGNLNTKDDGFMARACNCRPQTWRRVRDALLAKGKLHYKPDGNLTANRVENELQTLRKRMGEPDLLKSVSSPVLSEINELALHNNNNNNNNNNSTKKEKEEGPNGPSTPARNPNPGSEYVFEEGVIKLTKKDYEKLISAYAHINVPAALLSIGDSQWLKERGRGWFMAVRGFLDKREREMMVRLEEARSKKVDNSRFCNAP